MLGGLHRRWYAAARQVVLSPAVQWRVSAHNIDVDKVLATGPKNNILKGDILSYLQSRGGPLEGRLPQSVVLILTETHTEKLREFVASVHPAMQDRLLTKAVCHALARTKGPEMPVTIVDSMGVTESIAGAPISTRGRPSDNDAYLRVSFANSDGNDAKTPLRVNVTRSGKQYILQVESTDNSLDMTRFLGLIAESAADPYLMLL